MSETVFFLNMMQPQLKRIFKLNKRILSLLNYIELELDVYKSERILVTTETNVIDSNQVL